MIHGIDHTALSVPDFDKALDFYCGVLGFEAEFKAGWPKGAKPLDDLVGLKDSASKVAMIRLGDTKIEVFQYENPVGKPQVAGGLHCQAQAGGLKFCPDSWTASTSR